MYSSSQILQVGMPHLDIFGLSELFCLSNAGNAHWSLISKLTSKMPTEWRSEEGERIYASFIYTAVTYSRYFDVQEDDTIRVECVPRALRPPFFITETNYINSDAETVVSVKLMSTFSQTYGNSNARFLRSSMDFHSDSFGEAIVESTRNRFKEMQQHDDRILEETDSHLVNPVMDFNAANFMYFANYSQLFKRYECPALHATTPLKFREIAYFGNVDPFERLTIFARRSNMEVVSAMKRSSDQKCIARSFSVNHLNQNDIPSVEAVASNGEWPGLRQCRA